ncbi:MAG: FprA family A-type flavoprotein [Lachnospiraceae bacterium]|nr:FprA family A-type flavoprotein [Lachnospiraceae bacterium]
MDISISNSIKYIGVDDEDIDLFESQYVVPEGVSYNSYLIMDEKIALMDTVDERKEDEWAKKLIDCLDGKKVDYLVVSHMEPDHSGSIERVLSLFPDVTLVGNAKTFQFMAQFIDADVESLNKIVVKEGDELSLGEHVLSFYMAPMVHWPEVMVTYEKTEKVLFSADGFGKFGALELTAGDDWACEARRYYFNIVGKYGAPVQMLLKKVSTLDIEKICPLHGPILTENLSYYIGLYDTWSKYEAENKGVLVAYASIHGNTGKAAEKIGELLREAGVEKVVVSDLAREDMAEVIEDAFRYDKMVLCGASYDAGVFPCMQDFLNHLQAKAYQNRKVALLENGSWAPSAAKTMRSILETMKDITILDPVVTIKSTMKDSDMDAIKALVVAVANS